MFKQVWDWIPYGVEVRRYVALLFVIKGVLYLTGWSGRSIILPYGGLFEVWVYGAMLLMVGLLLALTERHRLNTTGRMTSVLAMVLAAFFMGGLLLTNRQQATTYLMALIAMFKEAGLVAIPEDVAPYQEPTPEPVPIPAPAAAVPKTPVPNPTGEHTAIPIADIVSIVVADDDSKETK